MKKHSTAFVAATLSALALGVPHIARADDGIFPPAAAAKKFIDFDGRGFIINGKRTFLVSGSVHYARVPRGLWRDRLLKLKRAGFTCVETYAFWNIHEPKEGQFNFSGEADLDAFLTTAQEVGLYAVVRVGPYICAEWENGGYPMWLRFKPGLEVRKQNAAFEAAVDAYFGKLIPIVARHQISRGGNVVMVQVENEHPQGWGKDTPNEYFRHLRDTVLGLGIEVPWFFSGLHHGSDPAGDRSWDSKGRTNPWYTTEFWPGWFDLYGPLSPDNLRRFDRGTWKILAYGGNGYNYYMVHGGSNFDYDNSNEDAASYDYAAAIGQAGDLRPIYYRFKRAAYFAHAFQDILEDSENADAKYAGSVVNETDGKIKVTARTSPAGDIAFLDNNNGATVVNVRFKAADGTSLPKAGPLQLAAGEIVPIVQNFQLAPGVKLDVCAARILGTSVQGKTTTLVVYGDQDKPFEVHFTAPGAQTGATDPGPTPNAWTQNGDALTLQGKFKSGVGDAYSFKCGDQTIRVWALDSEMADKAWFAESNGQNFVVSGPDYLQDINWQNGKLNLQTQFPWNNTLYDAVAFGEGAKAIRFPVSTIGQEHPRVKTLAIKNWQVGGGSEPASATYNDATWSASDDPRQMNSDGDLSCYVWYRTNVNAPAAGKYSITYQGTNGNFQAFVDGKAVETKATPSGLTLDLGAGNHSLAIFASHNGRDKFFGYMGSLENNDVKGINGEAYLSQFKGEQELAGWKMKKADGNAQNGTPPAVDNTWSDYKIGTDAFNVQAGWAWFSTTLPNLDAVKRIVHFASTDEDATVFLNGQKLGGHKGWNQAFDIDLTPAWKNDGPNVLSVLIHNESNTGGIDQAVTLAGLAYRAPLKGWKMRGGPGDPKTIAWKPLNATAANGPQWYHATFDYKADATELPIYRLKMRGMSRGSVWLNGHNIGRYPERIPVDGMYLPESWLQNGQNVLEVFDEEGHTPQNVVIETEDVASNQVVSFATAK